MSNYKVGDTVYIISTWAGVEEAEITGKMQIDAIKVFNLHTKCGSTQRTLEGIFPTHEVAISFMNAKDEAIREGYRKQIIDVSSLVKFMLDHAVSHCEEYTDYEARTVAIEKTKELLGIDLSDSYDDED